MHVGPLESLAAVVLVLGAGTAISLRASRPGGGPTSETFLAVDPRGRRYRR